jgi:hypothetical protein
MNYIKKFNKYDNSINETHEAKLHQLISSVSSEKMEIFIPKNKVIKENGEFTINKIVDLLRKYKHNPEAIQFIADMLEE